jgi:peptidoglycan/xylan/chitin deacetylase (PgdA/CDA1 family)
MKVKISLILCLLLLVVLTGCQKSFFPKPAPVPIPPNAKLVCLFFDDGFANQYDVALPILLQYNFKATFGIITHYIGTGHDLMRYMDEKQLEALAEDGMDIASHTQNHVDLTTLSYGQMHDEIFGSKQDLENMGFTVTTIVYPYYNWNDKVVEYAIAANYTCGRAGWTQDRVFDLTNQDPKARYHVTAWQITNQDMNNFKNIVDKAGPNTVVSLVYHLISDEGPEATSTPVANFKEQMAYLKNAGFTVIPLPDIFRQ